MNTNTDDPDDDPTAEEVEAYEFSQWLQQTSEEFDTLCQTRWEDGAKEYGPVAFMGNDVIQMMIEELADTSNYCRMQYIKLRQLQFNLENDPRVAAYIKLNEDENNSGFKKNGSDWEEQK